MASGISHLLPPTLPARLSLPRLLIPGYAIAEDEKVSALFTQYFRNLPSKASAQHEIESALSLAERHIAAGKGWFAGHREQASRLEHYVLAARRRMGLFTPGTSAQSLTQTCLKSNGKLLQFWKTQGFSERIFWSHPDLVDFVVKGHLHRFINHLAYKHTIQIDSRGEPCLLVEGTYTPWSKLKGTLQIDKMERFYSMEKGKKQFWMYLDAGFTKWDRHAFDKPHHFKKVDHVAKENQVEIVTSHALVDQRGLFERILDRVFKGARHTFVRVIPGKGFRQRHPEAHLEEGCVYSFGWGRRRQDVSWASPITTVRGKWSCPDAWEFGKADLKVTPIKVSDDQLLRLTRQIKDLSHKEIPFNLVSGNCCKSTAGVLRGAGIVDLSTKEHFGDALYRLVFPSWFRKGVSCIGRNTPEGLVHLVRRVGKLAASTVGVPLFTLLGGWRTKITFDREEDLSGYRRVARRFKALYANLFDLFNSRKLTFDMTKSVSDWQNTQPGTYWEREADKP